MLFRYCPLFALTFLLSSATLAQSTATKFVVGIKIGSNFSQLDNLSYQTPRPDWNGLPVLVGMQVGPFRLNAGPMASLNVLGGDLKGALSQYSNQPFNQTIRQTQLGYQAGAGLTFGSLHIDVRREGGFKKRTQPDPVQLGSLRPKLWQLTVGFNF